MTFHRHFSFQILLAIAFLLIPKNILAKENTSPGAQEIVASFSILQSIAQKIAGEEFVVKTLVEPNQDAHVFEAKPTHLKLLAKTRLLIVNGLQFDAWALRLAGGQFHGEILDVSKNVKALQNGPYTDPHAWQNPENGLSYAQAIADRFSQIYPSKKETYKKNLETFEKNVHEIMAQNMNLLLPYKGQKALSTHEAFNYFTQAYGIHFVSFYGLNTDSELPPQKIKSLLELVKKEKVNVLFLENSKNDSALKNLLKNENLIIGQPLFSDALSNSTGPAKDYFELLKYNAKTVADALKKANSITQGQK